MVRVTGASDGGGLRIGLALGAGSAAAMAEIGVAELLTRVGVPIHCVAGTSAGAIVGAAYACGRIAEFREGLSSLTRPGVLRLFDLAWPREGFLHGRRALEFIRPHLGDRIEDLPLPYAAVATDLRSGDEVILSRGSVLDAVRASIAIPGIFTPWRVGGRLLVDGGLVNPVPVSAARALGAEFVIAVNVLPLRSARQAAGADRDRPRLVTPEAARGEEVDDRTIEDSLGLTEIVWQASRILESQIATSRLREDRPEFLLQIPVPDIGMFDVHRTSELAELGRREAEEALPALRRALERAIPLSLRLREWARSARPSPFRKRNEARSR